MKLSRYVFGAVLVVAVAGAQARAAKPPTAGDCDGFPRLGLKTAPGMCVGLVQAHLGFVRGVACIGKDVYVADMGGWRKGRGRVLPGRQRRGSRKYC